MHRRMTEEKLGIFNGFQSCKINQCSERGSSNISEYGKHPRVNMNKRVQRYLQFCILNFIGNTSESIFLSFQPAGVAGTQTTASELKAKTICIFDHFSLHDAVPHEQHAFNTLLSTYLNTSCEAGYFPSHCSTPQFTPAGYYLISYGFYP